MLLRLVVGAPYLPICFPGKHVVRAGQKLFPDLGIHNRYMGPCIGPTVMEH